MFFEGEKFKKPEEWAFDPGFVAPEWLPFWDGARVVLPFWEGSSDAFDLANGLQATLNGAVTWVSTKYGISPNYTNTIGDRFSFPNSSIFDVATTQLTLAFLATPGADLASARAGGPERSPRDRPAHGNR